MPHDLGTLTHEETEAVFEMRDPKMLPHDLGHMSRIMVYALKSPDAREVYDSLAWLGNRICEAVERLESHIPGGRAKA